MALLDLNSAGVKISASTTSASAAIPMEGATTVRITNDGTTVAYVASGITAPTATSANREILPSTCESFAMSPDHKFVAAVMASGTANIGFTFSVGGE